MSDLLLQRAAKRDFVSLKKLWARCFDELPEAIELFFERNISYTRIYKAELDGVLCAAVYLVECSLNGQKAHYLCGAATDRPHRKRGIMSALISFALDDSKRAGEEYSVLFPANEELYGFYEKLGYVRGCAAVRRKLTRSEMSKISKKEIKFEKKTDFERLQKECLIDNFLLQNNNFISFAADYYSLYGSRVVFSENCMAIFDEENGDANVFYCIYNDIKELYTLLLNSSDAGCFIFTHKANSNDADAFDCGMIKPPGGAKLPKNVFIGITLS